jgi:hypothetical protein
MLVRTQSMSQMESLHVTYLVPLASTVVAVGVSTFRRFAVDMIYQQLVYLFIYSRHVNLRRRDQEGMTVLLNRAADLAAPSVHGVGNVLFKFFRGSLVREAIVDNMGIVLVSGPELRFVGTTHPFQVSNCKSSKERVR